MGRTTTQLAVSITSHTKSRVPRKKIVGLIEHVVRAEKATPGELDIAVVDSREIARINRQYLNHAGPTDVISFDLSADDGSGLLNGQIVVCAEVARKQAVRHGCGMQEELLRYVAHGLLHLMRYDDTTEEKAKKMHARQEKLLKEFLG
ncbi:MAG: rRNA maturation RNase YbeY [Phycisphaerae bacterium]|nr:rRNA maturation RNase YbeY [Phycisphaerae bacterium]